MEYTDSRVSKRFTSFPDDLELLLGNNRRPLRALVEEVTDGDTIVCEIEFGVVYVVAAIRVQGINARERWRGTEEERRGGYEDWQFAQTILPVGTEGLVHIDPHDYTFRRWVSPITLTGPADFSEIMVENGHATAVARGQEVTAHRGYRAE